MRGHYLIAILATALYGEDLLTNQSGTAVAAGTWTQLTPTGYAAGLQAIGYDEYFYVPNLKMMCGWENIQAVGTEGNRSFVCYSYRENKRFVMANGGFFRDEHLPFAGHGSGAIAINPATSVAYMACCHSGGNAPEVNSTGMYWFDFNSLVGRNKQTAKGFKYGQTAQPSMAYDPFTEMVIMHGAPDASTWTYTPSTNVWAADISTTCTVACPPAGLSRASIAMNTTNKKIYLFGGGVGTGAQAHLYSYTPSAATWVRLSPSGTPPAGRIAAGWAYSSASNKFLLHGGMTEAGTTFNDTWEYDPVANAWTQLSPATAPPAEITGGGTYQRMVYFPEDDVFVMIDNSARYWAYRMNAGSNAGYASLTYPTMSTGLDRQSDTWAESGGVAVSGSNVYFAWTEAGQTGDVTDAKHFHAYGKTFDGSSYSNLGSAYSSISSTNDAHGASITTVSGTPWACYGELITSTISCKSWGGSSWSGGAIGNTSFQGQPFVIDANGQPAVAYREKYLSDFPYHYKGYVRKYNGSTWDILGSSGVNVQAGYSVVDSITLAPSGSNIYAAFSEWTMTPVGTPASVTQSNPQVYLSLWNGSTWANQCSGSANVSTGSGWAYAPSVAMLGSDPYVAFVERTVTGINKLYVRKCVSGSWSTVGSVYLNKDQNTGWVFAPRMVSDGSNLYVTWSEQGINQTWVTSALDPFASRSIVHVAQWNGSAWSSVGGALNSDSMEGSATKPRIALNASNNPIVAWQEIEPGNLSTVYAKQWDGTDWTALAAVAVGSAVGSSWSGRISCSGRCAIQ